MSGVAADHGSARGAGVSFRCPWILVVTACVGGAIAGAAAQPRLVDRVVARVGENVITMTDVEAATGFGIVDTGPNAPDPLQQVIDRRLALAEVMRRPPVPPDPAAVDAEVARLRAHARDRLSALMAATGVDDERLRRLALDDLRIAAYLQDRFPLVPAGDADAEQYYRTHPEAFVRNGTLPPFADVAAEARRAAAEERREARIAGWYAGLRNRIGVAIVQEQ